MITRKGVLLACMALLIAGCSKAEPDGGPSRVEAGGVTTVLTPDLADPDPSALAAAAEILRSRLAAAASGSPARVVVVGKQIRVTAPASLTERLPRLVAPARLEFRKILECASKTAFGGCYQLPLAQGSPSPGSGESVPRAHSGDAYTAAALTELDCSLLAARAGNPIARPQVQVVACAKDGAEKFRLDIAKVRGTHVKDARSSNDVSGISIVVSVEFTGDGQDRWTALTVEACGAGSAGSNQCPTAGTPVNRIAIVVDGVVYSSPAINEPIRGPAEISGNFTAQEARDLASLMKFGALPFGFSISEAR